jgi:tripartite-type tricarboxylate transporter receptor subunit TctC
MGKRIRILGALCSGLLGFAGAAQAESNSQAAGDFYRGKSINMLIGYSAGGGYDLYARMVSRYMGRHIPGAPTFVPQNMPGAGSLKVVNYLYQVAPRDGTAIGTFGRSLPLYPLLIAPADFDGTKLGYIGSVATDVSLCISWRQSPIQSWKDVLTKTYRAGGEGRGSEPDVFATVLQKVFDTKTQLITGYPGTAEMTLAMQRGELDGLCGISYSTLASIHDDWLKSGDVKILVQSATKKHPALPDVPLITDLTQDPKKKAILDLIVAPQEMARPFAAPPGLPPERLKTLRDAFDATMTDPEFLAEMKKSSLDVDPVSGVELQELVARLWASPKDVIDAAAAASGSEMGGSPKK